MTELPVFTNPLPFDDDANDQPPPSGVLGAPAPFAYVGQALTVAEFADYVSGYDFGSVPPDFWVWHHTAVPAASWAPYRDAAQWDAGEAGMDAARVRRKRLAQLDNLRDYYHGLGWGKGPHLFVDDRWIWLFTPMAEIGIHAKQGNSYHDGQGALHYSVGCEVIGYYEKTRWPDAVAGNAAAACAIVQRRLGTFQTAYRPLGGALSSHRDYNKPQCPGAAIIPEYYLEAVRQASAKLTQAKLPPAVETVETAAPAAAAVRAYRSTSPLVGPNAGPFAVGALVSRIMARGPRYDEKSVTAIVTAYGEVCGPVGVDPVLLLAQMLHECDWLRSWWCLRPRRNPAGLGVNGRKDTTRALDTPPPAGVGEAWAYNDTTTPPRWEMGLSFGTWREAAQAQAGRWLRYALAPEAGTTAQRDLMGHAMQVRPLPQIAWGSARQLLHLGAVHNPANVGKPEKEWVGWARPGTSYGEAIAALANALRYG